jgi:uncharacterized membrane protein
MPTWMQAGTPMVAAFLASMVEFVEALTIVLAVGTVRGWRPALAGVFIGGALLAALVLVFGPLIEQTPIANLQIVIGVLLVLFGMRWLRKAILRASGIIALHDEKLAFSLESRALQRLSRPAGKWDAVALVASLKAVFLEGLEVVFIVIAAGAASHALIPAVIGAVAALAVVVLLGIALHRPLALIPENTLKFVVGVLLSAFGAFWFGEGIGLVWPGGDLALLGLIAFFFAAALMGVAIGRAALPKSY